MCCSGKATGTIRNLVRVDAGRRASGIIKGRANEQRRRIFRGAHINAGHIKGVTLRVNGHRNIFTVKEGHGVELLPRGVDDIILQLLKLLVIERAVLGGFGFVPCQHRQLAHTTKGLVHRLHKTVLGLGKRDGVDDIGERGIKALNLRPQS